MKKNDFRINLKRKFNFSFGMILLTILISVFVMSLLFIKWGENYCFEYSSMEAQKIFNMVFSKIDYSNLSYEDFLQYKYDKEGKIVSIDLNQSRSNQILSELIVMLNHNLNSIKKEKYTTTIEKFRIQPNYNNEGEAPGIILNMPIGVLTNNSFFYSVGPKIPIVIEVIDANEGAIKTKVKDYGINSVLIEIYAKLEISGKIVLPGSSKKVKSEVRVLIDSQLIQGTVPQSYLGRLNPSA